MLGKFLQFLLSTLKNIIMPISKKPFRYLPPGENSRSIFGTGLFSLSFNFWATTGRILPKLITRCLRCGFNFQFPVCQGSLFANVKQIQNHCVLTKSVNKTNLTGAESQPHGSRGFSAEKLILLTSVI